MATLKSRLIYEGLRKDILAGKLVPAQRLVLRQLANSYGSSDIPAREALRMLEQEGLVEISPYQGARVSVLSPDRVLEAYFVRGHLEALATQLATTRLTFGDFDLLEGLVASMSGDKLDAIQFAELNRRFHSFIIEHCGNQVLHDAALGIWQTHSAFQVVFRLDPERQRASNDEHRQILQAMREGNAPKAHDLALEHKFATAFALSEALKKVDLGQDDAGGSPQLEQEKVAPA